MSTTPMRPPDSSVDAAQALGAQRPIRSRRPSVRSADSLRSRIGEVADSVRSDGLFVPRRALRRRGFTDGAIDAALARHEIFRVRQGWFSVPDAFPAAVEAVRIGGRLTGEAALETYDIWVDPTHRIDVVVRRNANELRRPNDRKARRSFVDRQRWRVFWTDAAPAGATWRVSIEEALGHLLRTSDRLTAIRCIDSALNRKRNGHAGIDESALTRLFAAAPERARRWRDDVDGRAESGGETQARLLCLDNGVPFEPQVQVAGVGRLDGRIGPHSYVEIDGEKWHDTESSFLRDRERDVASIIRGDRVLRLSYPLLRADPLRCLSAMRALAEQDVSASEAANASKTRKSQRRQA